MRLEPKATPTQLLVLKFQTFLATHQPPTVSVRKRLVLFRLRVKPCMDSRSRPSPTRYGADVSKTWHTYRYLASVLIARIIYIGYRLGYRVRHDIRCFLQRPNIVSRAINRNIAYVYYTRDRYRYGISTSVRELRAVGPKPARR